jgi:two-component system sensor histidine kinase DesK
VIRGAQYRWRALVWLVFILIPIIDALTSHDSGLAKVAVIAGALLYVAAFVGFVVLRVNGDSRLALPGVVLLLALATALTIVDRASWVTLLIYTASASAMVLPQRLAFAGVAASTALVLATQLIDHQNGGAVFGYTISTAGVGMLMLALADLRSKNQELREARAELARFAVARERERFARDLHDLLGHSLSVIALKSELAGRLVESNPAAAASEIADVQTVARQSLSEVREAVSGYRRPTLDSEIEGARVALSAAGVTTSIDFSVAPLDPDVEGALAWAVREGATNVIRHSRATRCAITVAVAEGGGARVEIHDDGVGAPADAQAASESSGHGLEGLLERAASLGGRVEAGAAADGGFRLAMTLP